MAHQKGENWIRRFIVSDPKKHKRGFTIYKVTSSVFPKAAPEGVTKVIVWKRYNDFKKLHRELKVKHQKLYLPDTFPTFAKSKFFGRFEDEVVEERRKCALTMLEFVGQHSPLFTSKEFVKFFEGGYTVDDVNDVSSELMPEILQPVPVGNGTIFIQKDQPDTATNLSKSESCTKLEGEGPLLRLGGIWQFPQKADSISLSSQSSEDATTFTDTDSALSGVSSPLQSADLQLFDPLQQTSPSKDLHPSSGSKTMQSRVSNSWLLSLPSENETNTMPRPQQLSPGTASQPGKGSRPAVGCTELPAETFLSIRTEDFTTATNELAVTEGVLGSDAFLSPPSSPGPHPPSHSVNYIFEAAFHVGQAQQQEANEEFEAAFAFYKAGIACMLSGVQDDPDNMRKQAVKEKTARYLLQAEKIYNQHLASKVDNHRRNAVSSGPTSLKPVARSHLSRPLSELKCFKVLGVVGKVMLVLNTMEDCCYIMKVLHKSPCPATQLQRSIMPQNVPYMVTMHRYFETESAVFLVLQHASGGKLWEHVGSYFQSLPSTPVRVPGDDNAYLGKKLIWDGNNRSSQVSDIPVFPADLDSSPDHSYLQLIQDYRSSKSDRDTNTGSEVQDWTPGPEGPLKKELRVTEDLIILELDRDCPGDNERKSNGDFMRKGPSDGNVTFLNPIPDLLPQDYSWKNLENLETTDLVENAQRLLESVSETLMKTETLVSSMATEMEVRAEITKAMVRCQSEDSTTSVRKVSRERKASVGRRLSTGNHARFSRERRFSSDDLFEGRARAHSGSLDRSHHWTRLQSVLDRPKPRLPEANVRVWVAELLVALDTLHRWGIICRDLNPDNVLLGERGHLLLTYQCQWMNVDQQVNVESVEGLYTAPEVSSIFPLTPAADWWSFGAIIFELFTGKSLVSCHPSGVQGHTILNIPDFVSEEAKSLLTELLRHNSQERLGHGVNGMQELKSHPFFKGVDWQAILDTGTT